MLGYILGVNFDAMVIIYKALFWGDFKLMN